MRWNRFDAWFEYVPVHERIAAARKRAAKRAKWADRQPEPVVVTGRDISKTFWGKSWCRNPESYSDFASRLPRGRTYARNGSVVDLLVARGRVEAIVAGSMVYDVAIAIAPLAPAKWKAIKTECATSIGSLVDLLTGRLDDDVMRRLVKPGEGMFPSPREVTVKCSCPDGARLCKHLAAVLYGVGHRLDTQPELLFLLRGVEQSELVAAATKESVSRAVRSDDVHALAADELAEIFGIDIGGTTAQPPAPKTPRSRGSPARAGKPAPKRKPARGRADVSRGSRGCARRAESPLGRAWRRRRRPARRTT